MCGGCRKTICSDCAEKVELSFSVAGMPSVFFEDTYMRLPMVVHPTSNWLGTYHACPACARKCRASVKQLQKVMASNNLDVELVSINYKGKKPFTGNPIYLETDWYRDFNDAEIQLKTMATFFDCDMVLDVQRDRSTGSEPSDSSKNGTHHFSLWRLKGKAVVVHKDKVKM